MIYQQYVYDLLPPSWVRQIQDVVHLRGIDTQHSEGADTFAVRTVTGEHVQEYVPWLWDLYAGLLRGMAEQAVGKPLYVQNLTHAAVTINQITAPARYEWHKDTNPVTGLLYLSTCSLAQGGALEFATAPAIQPLAGLFVCFEGQALEHRVAPLHYGTRISVPMNYFLSGTDQPRPDDLDAALFTPVAP